MFGSADLVTSFWMVDVFLFSISGKKRMDLEQHNKTGVGGS